MEEIVNLYIVCSHGVGLVLRAATCVVFLPQQYLVNRRGNPAIDLGEGA